MRVVNEQFFFHRGQRLVGGVEKRVCTHVVQWSDLFPLQYSPECFRDIQMWGIRRQIEEEKSSFLPDRPQLPYFMIATDGGIVKYDKRVLAHMERKCIRKVDKLVRGDILRSGEAPVMALSVNHPEDVDLAFLWDGMHTFSPGNCRP
jgi:hypothetical protein